MSQSSVNLDAGGAAAPAETGPAADAGRGWSLRSLPEPPQLPLPVIGVLIFAGIRVFGVAVAAFMLRHGKYREKHWTLVRWMKAADGGHYRAIAIHGYAYPAGQLAHASVFSWFPGYPAVVDTIAWLPGLTVIGAALVVTAIAGLTAAAGLTTLGMKLTANPRISLLMVAIWAVAPSATVLSMVYAEALFCALAVWALAALVGRRWLTAAVLSLAAGTVRSTALALIAAVMVAALLALVQAWRVRAPVAAWWRPLAAVVLAPLGLLGYLVYVAVATHRLDGWFWVEKHTCHMSFDWGVSTLRIVKGVLLDAPSVSELLVVLAIGAAAFLMLWSLTERIPLYLHVYTLVIVVMALTTSANWISSKPRFLLPAMLLALPVARLLAPLRNAVLVPLVVVLAAASTWFGLYLLVIGRWAP
jgi:hypothetical protein